MSTKRDDALLLDILLAARDAREFVEGMNWNAFSTSRLHQNAVIRSLEVIGEASGKLSPDVRIGHPEIPWSDMVGMRHRLIHDYGGTRLDIVWEVIIAQLPALIRTIEPLIPPPLPPDEIEVERDRSDMEQPPAEADTTPVAKSPKRGRFSPQ